MIGATHTHAQKFIEVVQRGMRAARSGGEARRAIEDSVRAQVAVGQFLNTVPHDRVEEVVRAEAARRLRDFRHCLRMVLLCVRHDSLKLGDYLFGAWNHWPELY